jgi:small subunit ribosomal protein S6
MGLSTEIIRFLTVRVDEHETEPSVMMRKSDRDERGERGERGFGGRGGGRGGFRGDREGGERRGGFRGDREGGRGEREGSTFRARPPRDGDRPPRDSGDRPPRDSGDRPPRPPREAKEPGESGSGSEA